MSFEAYMAGTQFILVPRLPLCHRCPLFLAGHPTIATTASGQAGRDCLGREDLYLICQVLWANA